MDQTVIELKNQFAVSRENQRGKTPLETEEGSSRKDQSEQRIPKDREEALIVVIVTIPINQIFTRWSRMEFGRFMGRIQVMVVQN